MAFESLDGAKVSMAPPVKPHHRSSSSIAQMPESPSKIDSFKRMSTASIATPISETSTRPNSMMTSDTVEEPSELSSPISRKSLTIETNPYLTAVAAQERRVLELREELQKAESELQILKRNWAHQETTKKRQEIRQNAEAMRPLRTPIQSNGAGTPTAETFRQSMDEERKRAFYARPRLPERRVFEGRHTRTLSLLSPGTLANRPPFSDVIPKGAQTPKTAELPACNTDGAIEPGIAGRPRTDSRDAKEDIVKTGKQLVGDIREGLWSFWDDLRQATVGEEASREPPHRRPSQQSRSPARSGALQGIARTSIASESQPRPRRQGSRSPHVRSNTIAATASLLPTTPQHHPVKAERLEATAGDDISRADGDDDGGWSNWDSPAAKTIASTTDAANSPTSTSRTSVSAGEEISSLESKSSTMDSAKSNAKFEHELMDLSSGSPNMDTLPWPALKKLRPGSLQKTASHLMKEWERSLTPPAEETEKDWIDRYIDGPRRPSTRETQAVLK